VKTTYTWVKNCDKKSSGGIFCVTIVYLKENSKIKDNFSRKLIRKTFFGSKMGG